MNHYRRRRRLAAFLALGVIPAVCAACAWVQSQTSPPVAVVPHMIWPEPPDPPRIELVSIFTRASELGIERSVWTRLASFITGGDEAVLVRPAGVAASRTQASGTRIAVADPGAGLVHVYDLLQRRSLALQGCGEATFAEPVAVAMLDDRLYVSDAAAARIHVFTFEGACEGSWALEPRSRPAGLAIDKARSRIYVADAAMHQVVGFDPHGQRVLQFGNRGVAPGEFNYPTWLAVDADGNLYVTDALNFRVQIFDPDGKLRGAFGNQGDASGHLARPKGVGVDRHGTIYLVDALFDAVQMFDREGRYLMVFGAHGSEAGHFSLPAGLAIDGDRVYVADSFNQRVQVFRILGGVP